MYLGGPQEREGGSEWTDPNRILHRVDESLRDRVGVFALALFSFLSAVYLTVDATPEREVQDDFRCRAMISMIVLGPVAALVFVAA